jgi:electron transfer flavoprotein beta subunit
VALRIVVLLKAVPPVGSERLDASFRTVRAAALEANGNDEYTLEAALKLVEKHGGEITLLAAGPAGALDAIRKGLAMGATRAVHVQDDSIAGSDIRATVSVLAAALKKLEFDLVLAGADTSDGQAGVVGAALAARLGLPYLSYASLIEPAADAKNVKVRRLTPSGYDVLEAPTPALIMGTQLLGDPRYPSLRGIMQARNKEVQTWSLSDLGVESATVGEGAATTKVLAAEPPPARAGATVVREAPDAAVAKVVEFLAARRLV